MAQPNEVPGSPAPPAAGRFDFAKPFTFVFEDPDWVPKVLIGGLFQLLGTVIIGSFFLFGYYARLVRNVIGGAERPLPGWDDLGEYFVEGLKLFAVALLFMVPIFGLTLLLVIPIAVLEELGSDGLGAAAGCLFPLVVIPLALATALVLPAVLLRVVVHERFSAAFELGEVFGLIRRSGVNYLLAILVHLLAGLVGQFGILLCVVGLFVTGFWAMAASAHAFAQAYRLARA
ncbi:MAG TPA: DUF4013 domain-containing protein [Thermoanaerobaculia bacterium]|nr:DUF4013 domain-containing protein [Thermoanaerobaculia bacterium]